MHQHKTKPAEKVFQYYDPQDMNPETPCQNWPRRPGTLDHPGQRLMCQAWKLKVVYSLSLYCRFATDLFMAPSIVYIFVHVQHIEHILHITVMNCFFPCTNWSWQWRGWRPSSQITKQSVPLRADCWNQQAPGSDESDPISTSRDSAGIRIDRCSLGSARLDRTVSVRISWFFVCFTTKTDFLQKCRFFLQFCFLVLKFRV